MSFSTSRYLAVILPLFVAILFLGNSGGPASIGNFFTGAPSAGGGTESTCNTCHSSGASTFGTPVINVSFTAGGETGPLTEYTPGTTYMVTVAIGHTGAAPAAYGFSSQMLNLANSPATAAGTLGNAGTATQIFTASSGRVYAEHSLTNPDSLFTFEWTAPEAGKGEVKLYVVGNLVNSNRSISGDSGSTEPTIVTLAEGISSGVRNFSVLPHRLFPNPTQGLATLEVTIPSVGNYDLRVISLNGQILSNQRFQLSPGLRRLPVPSASLPAGVYAVEVLGASNRLVARLVVK